MILNSIIVGKRTVVRDGYVKKHIFIMKVEQLPLVDRKIENWRLMKNVDDGCSRDQDKDNYKIVFTYIKNISAFSSLILDFL